MALQQLKWFPKRTCPENGTHASKSPNNLEGSKHRWFQQKLGAGQENLCHRGGCCYARGPCKRESNTSGCFLSSPSVFGSNQGRLSPARYGHPTSNKCPFLPSYTILIHFLPNRFIALMSNFLAAATLIPNPPLSLSGPTGLPFPSSASAATAMPLSLCWLTIPNQDKECKKIHV